MSINWCYFYVKNNTKLNNYPLTTAATSSAKFISSFSMPSPVSYFTYDFKTTVALTFLLKSSITSEILLFPSSKLIINSGL